MHLKKKTKKRKTLKKTRSHPDERPENRPERRGRGLRHAEDGKVALEAVGDVVFAVARGLHRGDIAVFLFVFFCKSRVRGKKKKEKREEKRQIEGGVFFCWGGVATKKKTKEKRKRPPPPLPPHPTPTPPPQTSHRVSTMLRMSPIGFSREYMPPTSRSCLTASDAT